MLSLPNPIPRELFNQAVMIRRDPLGDAITEDLYERGEIAICDCGRTVLRHMSMFWCSSCRKRVDADE